jgi:23S rRNA pseudouridine2605 synthase
VNGRPLPGRAPTRHYLFHKPVGVISTMSDPEGRRTIRDYLPPGPRLYPVGRLDADTSGLLILTNDGDLAHRLMHPRYGVRKVYRVRVQGHPTAHQLQRLRDGVQFEPGVWSAPAQVKPRTDDGERAIVEIALHEGRYRQVRRMFEAVGLVVVGLHRAGYGPLRLGDLPRGELRPLDPEEVELLRRDSARPNRVRRRGGMGPSAGRPRGPKIEPAAVARGPRPRGRAAARPGARPSARPSARPARPRTTARGRAAVGQTPERRGRGRTRPAASPRAGRTPRERGRPRGRG